MLSQIANKLNAVGEENIKVLVVAVMTKKGSTQFMIETQEGRPTDILGLMELLKVSLYKGLMDRE